MSTEDITHFHSIPWVSKLLQDDAYTTVQMRTRDKTPLISEDHFFSRTLNTATTIPSCLMQVKNPSPRFAEKSATPSSFSPAEEIRIFFTVGQDVMGPPGALHGGVVASLLDESMGLLLSSGGHFGALVNHETKDFVGPVTAYLNTIYKRRIPIPGTFVVYARLKEAIEDRKWLVEGEIRDEEDRVNATGECLFVKITARL